MGHIDMALPGVFYLFVGDMVLDKCILWHGLEFEVRIAVSSCFTPHRARQRKEVPLGVDAIAALNAFFDLFFATFHRLIGPFRIHDDWAADPHDVDPIIL